MPKHSSGVRGEFGGQQCQKRQKDPTKEERKCCHCPERREYRLQYVLILTVFTGSTVQPIDH